MKVDIPVFRQVDVLVLGATSGAVAAALAARRSGKTVLCATHFTYPGEDICAIMNYWDWGKSGESSPLAPDFFGRDFFQSEPATPMQVKYRLEQKMIEAGVDFLYMVYPFRVLRDGDGRVAGAVIADRSGFQVIQARVIIDASERAQFARLLRESEFSPFIPGDYCLQRVVASLGQPNHGSQQGRLLSGGFTVGDDRLVPSLWPFSRFFNEPSPREVALLDVQSRLESWHSRQLLSADRPDLQFGDRLQTACHQSEWRGTANFDLSSMVCGESPVFVLGPSADVSPAVSAMMRDPGVLIGLGDRLGRAAADLANEELNGELAIDYHGLPTLQSPDPVRFDSWFRAAGYPGLELDLGRMPVLGQYDVVVAGGGTAGAPAGIAAGRAGVKCLVLEYLAGLGGMGTEGRIAAYYHGNRCGFTTEIDQGVMGLGEAAELPRKKYGWNSEWKKHWFLRAAHEAGTEVWFGAMAVAAAMDEGRVRGLVVATPYGCGLIKAGQVVDATGNADVVAAAGGPTMEITTSHVAVQGTGLSRYVPGEHYANSDHTFVDDNDLLDVTRAFAVARQKFRDFFDISQIVESRERRQIRGELTLEPLDFLAGRSFEDTVVTASSNFDSHGFTVHPVFLAKPPDRQELRAHVPYRCLLPLGLEGVLATGLAVSSHRDSLPVIRMQPDVQNQGYSAGRAAAMAVLQQTSLRKIDLDALQQHLVEVGILEPEVVTDKDSPPLSDGDFAWAVSAGQDDYLGLAIIFSDPGRSRPLLRAAYQAAEQDSERLRCARLLGLLADNTGVATMIDWLSGRPWDRGWHYTGMGQFGYSMSEMDSTLVALGYSEDRRAIPVVLEKLSELTVASEFSHCRAVSLALAAQPTPAAVEALTALLEPLRGNHLTSLAQAVAQAPADQCDTSERNRELKELVIARGLLVCGDNSSRLARNVLTAYANDLHGHYARHARTWLQRHGNDNHLGSVEEIKL